MTELDEKMDHYMKYGWAPASQDHLPDVIQNALGEMGLEPRIKECFANSQRFVLDCQRYGLDLDVEYHEGWVLTIIPIEHAWLMWEGEVLDLTLGPEKGVRYLESRTYTREEIIENMVETHMYTPLTEPQEFYSMSPWGKLDGIL